MSVDSFLASGNSPGDFLRPSALVAGTPRCRVGSSASAPSAPRSPAGSAAPIAAVDGLELTHILDRRALAKRDAAHGPSPAFRANIVWTTRFEDVLASDVDVVVEAIGGIEPAADWIRAALHGRQVGRHRQQAGDCASRPRRCSSSPSGRGGSCASRPPSAARCRSCARSATASPAIGSRASSRF